MPNKDKILQNLKGTVTKIENLLNLTFTIKCDSGKEHEVNWSRIKLGNDLELIPYELALLNQEVTFKESRGYLGPGLYDFPTLSLELLSGPLRGREYVSHNIPDILSTGAP
ncbi:hypothetical protein GOV13_01080 [Candidatus Pacearchaeota archaeon]|nr:hypothetical protein [Candidatus Pacearchaeota archaeon]